MMRVHAATDAESGALILTVDAEGLEGLLELLQRLTLTAVPLTRAVERAATRPISALNLAPSTDEALMIATEGEAATITGSPAGFARLARRLKEFTEYNDLSEPGMHVHFDPGDYSGAVLAQDSRSLIVAGPVPDQAATDR
jgi:hypothetical protein